MEKKARTRLVIVIAIVLVLLAILLYRSSIGSLSYFKTVSELKKDTSLIGKSVRVGGEVAKDSIVEKQGAVTFTLTDKKESITVIYGGTMPSAFGEGLQVIAEGTYQGGNNFEAKSLITKCPSKYKTEKIRAQ